MLHHSQLLAFTRRGALVLWLVCSLSVFALAGTTTAPVATSVSATTSGASTFITISGTAPMTYSISKPDARTILINLPGVDASRLAPGYTFHTPLVGGLTVQKNVGPKTAASSRLRVSLLADVRDRSQLDGNNLVLVLSPATAGDASVKPAAKDETLSGQTSQRPAQAPASRPNVQINPSAGPSQSSQGLQYGQPGFVGEPINLNVVNADIRDILSYITEQYGVNFVIDNSVKDVPVTVNVSDVPWNVALEAILRANRLGVEVQGNILRVATEDIIASEVALHQKLNEARLNNSPLVTEFIRLNYARATGTLSATAGGAAGFTGGSTSGSGLLVNNMLAANGNLNGASGSTPGNPNFAQASAGEQGLLPIIRRRLSTRGGIEVDERSNTLIITDVRENIDAIRQLVAILDQPEPQVEIETRIVIGTRNFSRDLGVQLASSVLNRGTGGLGSFSTLPATSSSSGGSSGGNSLTSGPNLFGVPGGLAGTNQPLGNLAAAAASTVIGLTTGLMGTAQISSLITAAEAKGQAKTVATPRVTALNNRTAQIESGTQIPIQTALATSGATTVTTTFVNVPLRLSITPQITDVGTVVLRVTIENNTVNQTIAVGGTPGIDTQRMTSEVLVPDGGTTVMGGVLADTESELQQRTPGIASLPVVGNLFKRRQAIRSTSEILFFITPRIYRPDYEGRPTAGRISTGTRSATISQPVPLGNPPTNTPTSGQPSTTVPAPIVLQPSAPAAPQTRP